MDLLVSSKYRKPGGIQLNSFLASDAYQDLLTLTSSTAYTEGEYLGCTKRGAASHKLKYKPSTPAFRQPAPCFADFLKE